MQTKCHLSVLAHNQAKKYGSRKAMSFCNFGEKNWSSITWNDFSCHVMEVSNALLNLGLKPQEKVAVFSQNCVEYLYSDFGAYGVRLITIPFYATSSEQQIQFMIHDAEVKVIFVGEQEQYDKAYRVFSVCPSLERIVVFDSGVVMNPQDTVSMYFKDFLKPGEGYPRQSEVEEQWRLANNEEICNILYTSGTTGDPKGVILTHGQYRAALDANDKVVPVGETDRVMNFLPFTHIFEKAWTYFCISEGASLIINTDPKEILQSLKQIPPTCMCAVPRFWEKVYVAVKEKMESATTIQKKLFAHALNVGRKRNIEYLSKCRRVPLALELEYKMMNKTVLSMVRGQLGLKNPNIFPTAGAYVSPEVEAFVHSIGLNMIVGYGLTESLATVSCDQMDKGYTIGSVGRPIEGIEVKIGEDNEILLKGPTITRGYYKRDNINAEVFDEDGFFHTGDAGYMKDGELYLTERIKDLFKTSNGKYIAPQMVESMLLVDKYIDQVAVVADKRKFVSALIVPDFRLLEEWAREWNVPFNDYDELCSNVKVLKMMMERIETLQQGLASYEKVKRIALIPKPFSMESGELTNTLKLKRAVVYKNYGSIIEKLYE